MDSHTLEFECAKVVQKFLSGEFSASEAALGVSSLLHAFEYESQAIWVELGGSIGKGGEMIQGECDE